MNVPIQAWLLIKDTVEGFINDNALSRGASIAYYTLFAIAPVLLIIVAIAGLALGHDAAQGSIVGQLSGLMGDATAKAIEEMIKSAANRSAGKGEAAFLDPEPVGASPTGEPGPCPYLRLPAHGILGGQRGTGRIVSIPPGIVSWCQCHS